MPTSVPTNIISTVLKNKRKKLLFIIGDGFQPVDTIVAEKEFRRIIKKKYGKREVATWGKERQDFERWKYLEYARFFTNNVTPSLGYFVLHHLIKQKTVKGIITTNYDLYLNSILERTDCASDGHCFNPVVRPCEFDWEGYYSDKKRSTTNSLIIYKIHGSLTHVVFRNCYYHNNQLHIFKLPSFVVGFDTRQIRTRFNIRYLHNYMGHIGLRHGDPTLVTDNKRTGYYVHYIDWAVKYLCKRGMNYRDFFLKEIEHAKRELKKTSDLGAVVIIGFTGYYNEGNPRDERNEELSPTIKSILKKVPIFYFLHEEQHSAAASNSNKMYLWNAVKDVNSAHVDTYSDTGSLLLQLICKQQRQRNSLEAEYKSDWVNGEVFLDPSKL